MEPIKTNNFFFKFQPRHAILVVKLFSKLQSVKISALCVYF